MDRNFNKNSIFTGFAKAELDGYILGTAPAVLDDLAAGAIGTALQLAVEKAALMAPGDVVVGFELLVV